MITKHIFVLAAILIVTGCTDTESDSSSIQLVSDKNITDRPNILWITTEDHGPHIGAYGDTFAYTPFIDAFAERGMRYDMVWSNAPVCAPARTAILTGVYPPSTGSEHMRS
ncbi:MAG: sulfatase-like hydrolase/transferase, partial [Balneolaceae bacterium]